LRVLVTGAAGMLGARVVAEAVGRGWEAVGIDLPDADLTDPEAAIDVLQEHVPDAVVHCAAWTDVDAAEAREADAARVNVDACANVGAACAMVGARVVGVSTDYVFDGTADRPYVESDPTAPLGAYGRTKLAGEQALLAHCDDAAVARTAWLFGAGGKNFCDTMLGLAATRDEVAVVTDQVGSPTWTGHLAPALLDLAARRGATGVFHTAGAGQVSWHGLTVELFARAGVTCRVAETTAATFARPAPRPAWSVLATERPETPTLPAWQDGVAGFLAER
jgi:dTDP-4-dehydrorhamnose reductase